MKSFIDFSENLDDKKKQLMQKQKVMQQMERERASRSNQEFQQDKEEKQFRIDQEKEEKKRLEQLKKEIKDEIKQEMGEVDEEFGKMTKKQTQAYTGMDDKEQKALYKKMKKDGNFDVKKNLSGAASDDKDLGEESNPRIPRKKGQPANSKKHSDLYTDEILKELFMDLVSRTLLLLKHLSQRSGILLDRMLIKFKLLLLWNKGQEKWVKPLKQQSTENSSTQ